MSARPAAALERHSACQVNKIGFDGWQAEEVKNDWVQLIFVPALGGRLMQVVFNGHPYLFVNPKVEGKYISPSEADGRWINYGGDKIWPMPEGSQDEHHWVLQSSPLDDGAYTFKILSRGVRCVVQLQGPPDPPTGLQYTRQIGLDADSPTISFHAVMKNYTAHPIRWGMQSVTQYDLADPENPEDYNHELWAFAPMNRNSAYLDGYHVVDGLSDDPSFSVNDGLFKLNWKYLQNEVWLDSKAGWITVVDEKTGYAMTERFHYVENANYPGKATVIFYKNGPSIELNSKGYPELTPADAVKTPYYMEAELNSPVVVLQPGSEYAMDTTWFPSRANGSVKTVEYPGVVFEPFTIVRTSSGSRVTGSVGAFFPGMLEADLFDKHGIERSKIDLGKIAPQNEVEIDKPIPIQNNIVRVVFRAVGAEGQDYGSFGDVPTPAAIRIN